VYIKGAFVGVTNEQFDWPHKLLNASIAVDNVRRLRNLPVSPLLPQLLGTRSGEPEWTVAVCEHWQCAEIADDAASKTGSG